MLLSRRVETGHWACVVTLKPHGKWALARYTHWVFAQFFLAMPRRCMPSTWDHTHCANARRPSIARDVGGGMGIFFTVLYRCFMGHAVATHPCLWFCVR